MSQPNYAQFNDWGTKFGFRGSMLFPQNEFANFGFSGNNNFHSIGGKFPGLVKVSLLLN
jgi:hypothetical protein